MGAPEASRDELSTVEVKIIYKASGRIVKLIGPAKGKLFDWIQEIDAREEVAVEISSVSNPLRFNSLPKDSE